MQAFCLNGVVANRNEAKVQKNIFLHREVADLADELIRPFGAKRGWAVYTAALLAFVRLEPGDRGRLVGDAILADITGDVGKLVGESWGTDAGGEDSGEVRPPFSRRVGKLQQKPTGGKGPVPRRGAAKGTRNPPPQDQSK